MKITVRVKPGSAKQILEKTIFGEYTAYVHARAEGGKANAVLIELLAKAFEIPKSRIIIISGHKSRVKIIEITGV